MLEVEAGLVAGSCHVCVGVDAGERCTRKKVPEVRKTARLELLPLVASWLTPVNPDPRPRTSGDTRGSVFLLLTSPFHVALLLLFLLHIGGSCNCPSVAFKMALKDKEGETVASVRPLTSPP